VIWCEPTGNVGFSIADPDPTGDVPSRAPSERNVTVPVVPDGAIVAVNNVG
jgi:hypothetical protein